MSHTNAYTATLKRRLITGTLWAIIGRALALLMSLAVSAFLARMLTPTELGLYFLVFSLVSAGALLAQLGLSRSVVRLVATSLARSELSVAAQRTQAVLMLGIGSAITVAVVMWSIGDWIIEILTWPSTLVGSLVWAAIWSAALALVTLQAEVFRGYHDIRSATLFGGLATNVAMAIVLAALWVVNIRSYNATLVIQVAALTTLAIATVGIAQLRGVSGPIQPNFWKVLPTVVKKSWPLFFVSIAAFVLTQVDLWIVGKYRPQEEVALYGAAARIVLLISTPMVIANAVIPPLIVELHALGRLAQLQRVLQAFGAFTSVPMLAGIAILIGLAGPILSLVYGEFYRGATAIFVVLALGTVALSILSASGMVLTMTGHRMTILGITSIAGCITVVMALWLVQTEGAVGVAVATATGSTMQFIMLWIAARLRVGIWAHAGLWRPQHLREAWRLLRSPNRLAEEEAP